MTPGHVRSRAVGALSAGSGAIGAVDSQRWSPSREARRSFVEVLGEGRSPVAPARPPAELARPAPPARPAAGAGPPDARAVLSAVLRSERHIDALLAAAARGRSFSAGELLALQSTVFQYSQVVEVVARATDRLLGSVKQTLGTQV